MDMYERISGITVNQIIVFSKCMELENYSKAAKVLNYTPSMVNKAMRKMEERLGLVLFVRHGAHIKPTRAAYELEQEWSHALNAIGVGVQNAYIAQEGRKMFLRVGLIDNSEYVEELVLSRIKDMRSALPRLFIEKEDMHALPGWLKRERYDVIITAYHERDQLNSSDYVWKVIEFSNLAFFYPEGHPLYNKEDVQLKDFGPYDFVTMDPLTNTGFHEMFLAACRSGGFEPHISGTVLNSRSLRFSLETSTSAVCGDETITQWENDHIKRFVLDVPKLSGLIVAWRKVREDESILRFVDIICNPVGEKDKTD